MCVVTVSPFTGREIDVDVAEIAPVVVAVAEATPVKVRPARARASRGLCVEPTCRTPLRESGRQDGARFCSKTCHATYHNRQKTQGRALVNLAKRWRREGRRGDFTALTRLLDSMIAADKEIGLDRYPEPPIEAFQVRRHIGVKARR